MGAQKLSSSPHTVLTERIVSFALLFTHFFLFLLGEEFQSLSFHKSHVKHISKSNLIQNPQV